MKDLFKGQIPLMKPWLDEREIKAVEGCYLIRMDKSGL